MADLEPRVEKLENKVTELELRTDRIITKLDMFIEESRAARERQDADMREIRSEMSNLAGSFRNMNITVIIGIAAMVIAVLLNK